jgi:hypothetical protein
LDEKREVIDQKSIKSINQKKFEEYKKKKEELELRLKHYHLP